MADDKRKFIFGSKYPGYLLVLEPGGPKYIDKQFIPKMPFKGVNFNSGVYDTTDEALATEMKNHPMYGKDFWEITIPEEAKKVNPGRLLEAAEGVRGTGHMPQRK
jgi:hypothetical protein